MSKAKQKEKPTDVFTTYVRTEKFGDSSKYNCLFLFLFTVTEQ